MQAICCVCMHALQKPSRKGNRSSHGAAQVDQRTQHHKRPSVILERHQERRRAPIPQHLQQGDKRYPHQEQLNDLTNPCMHTGDGRCSSERSEELTLRSRSRTCSRSRTRSCLRSTTSSRRFRGRTRADRERGQVTQRRARCDGDAMPMPRRGGRIYRPGGRPPGRPRGAP
jgi:hypothetical protein